MTDTVLSFVEHATNGNVLVALLVRKKAVSRQYHTRAKRFVDAVPGALREFDADRAA